MKTTKSFVLVSVFFAGILFTSCTSKGKPSQVGELITVEQLKSLPSDDSWNNKSVAVDAYLSYCRALIKFDRRNKAVITTEPGCKSDRLIEANISIKDAEDKSVLLGGEESRNYVAMPKSNLNIEDAEFVLDDYQKVGYQKMRISGTLIYNNGEYYMNDVTLHSIK